MPRRKKVAAVQETMVLTPRFRFSVGDMVTVCSGSHAGKVGVVAGRGFSPDDLIPRYFIGFPGTSLGIRIEECYLYV